MSEERIDLLLLSGGIFVMMLALSALKLAARRRALDAKRTVARLRRRSATEP